MSMVDIVICRDIVRPEAGVVEAFRGPGTGPVCDAQGRQGALSADIRCMTTHTDFVGPALVIDAGPKDNLAAWVGLKYAQPGDVLVIATGGYRNASVIGDVFTGMARNAGVIAIVTDGMIRDREGIDRVGIPVFASGISPNSPWKLGPGSVGLSCVVGDTTIHSGDLVIGDQDGITVVPRAQIEVTKEELLKVLEKERKMGEVVASGASLPDWVDPTLSELNVKFV